MMHPFYILQSDLFQYVNLVLTTLFSIQMILSLECSKTARAVKLHTENLDARKEKDEAKAEMKRLQVCVFALLFCTIV